jgi:hypothetical protein
MPERIAFEIGGRYRNRIGWYEVLDIRGDEMRIRYELNQREDDVSIKTQTRIVENMMREEERVTPHASPSQNQRYFITLGYLSRHSFIEAIIPPKSQAGFDRNYFRIKGRHPSAGLQGYYVHPDLHVDKWGVEMRLTFDIPSSILESDLDFGGPFTPVLSPDPGKLRINNNEFCYRLLGLGFELGENHNATEILANVPQRHKSDFQHGLTIT